MMTHKLAKPLIQDKFLKLQMEKNNMTKSVDATQGALALYLNEVQPVDGRVQINVSIDELTVLRHLVTTPAVGGLDEMAEVIHKARWPADRVIDITPFTDEDRNGREYCFRIARAVLAAAPLRGSDLIPAGKQAKFKHGRGGDWFGVYDWHNDPESFEYRTVYALSM